MSSELYADKVWFYGSISSDPEIKKLGAVGRIRDLTEQMIQYIGHANLANRAMYARLMRAVETPTESSGSCLGEGKDFALVEQADEHGFIVNGVYKIKKKQVFLDFQDIVDIAISVGMSSRPWAGLRNILFNRNLMDPFVQAHASNYHEFARTGNLYTEFLEDDVAPSVELAFDETRPDEMKLKGLKGIFAKSVEHASRMGELLWMSEASALIINYYGEEERDFEERNRNGDYSWFTANWGDDRLPLKTLKRLSEYFLRQASVNGYLFRTLDCLGLRLSGADDPSGQTDADYRQVIEIFETGGLIELEVSEDD